MTLASNLLNREQIIALSNTLESPFFCYDIAALRERMNRLQEQAASERLKLFLAVKANPLSRILTTAAEAGFGFDVASRGELEQVLTNVESAPLIITGPAKSRELLRIALEKGVNTFVLESRQQLVELDTLAVELGYQPEALLRVQLQWEQGEANVLGGAGATPFGLPPEEWLKLSTGSLTAVRLRGFHCFQWGNILDVRQLKEIWRHIGEVCQRLAIQMNIPFEILDVGGGLGIPYTDDQTEIQWEAVVDELALLREQLGRQELWLELGRYAVGPCGSYVCQVVDRKSVYGQELLVVDGGINHLLRPALTGTGFPCSLVRDSEASSLDFQVHGPLCTALDCLGTFSLPADIQAGDLLMFHQCGAYGFTEAMPYFLCHSLPAEVTIDGSRVEVLRAPQQARNYLC